MLDDYTCSCSNPRFSVFIIIHYYLVENCPSVKNKHYHVTPKINQSLSCFSLGLVGYSQESKDGGNREDMQLDCLCATGESLLNRLNSFQLDGIETEKKNFRGRNGKGGSICLKKKKVPLSFKLHYY